MICTVAFLAHSLRLRRLDEWDVIIGMALVGTMGDFWGEEV